MKTPARSHGPAGGGRAQALDWIQGYLPASTSHHILVVAKKKESFSKVNWEHTGLLLLTSALQTSPSR